MWNSINEGLLQIRGQEGVEIEINPVSGGSFGSSVPKSGDVEDDIAEELGVIMKVIISGISGLGFIELNDFVRGFAGLISEGFGGSEKVVNSRNKIFASVVIGFGRGNRMVLGCWRIIFTANSCKS